MKTNVLNGICLEINLSKREYDLLLAFKHKEGHNALTADQYATEILLDALWNKKTGDSLEK